MSKIYDATTISAYLRCPRYYFYRMHLHWVTETAKPALTFGLAMHKALEHLYSHYPDVTETDCVQAFTVEWLKSGLDLQEFHPRSLTNASAIIKGYFERYSREFPETKVYGVEVPFTIDLSPTLAYGGRIDAIVEIPSSNGPCVLEHKTAASFRSGWMNGFNPNIQIFGYSLGVRSLYEESRGQVFVNGLLVQKTSVDFIRVPCMPSDSALQEWRWEVADIIESIRFDEERFSMHRIGFVKNPEACTMWGSCSYIDLCQARPKAVDWLEIDVPAGFKIEPWDYEARMKGD